MPLTYEEYTEYIILYLDDVELTFEILAIFSRFKKIDIFINEKFLSLALIN